MPELPHESLQRIRALCHELSVRYRLDEQTRDELCGHLEDKLMGYLSGDVRITEEDALLLVRSHFGDAERIAWRLGRRSPLGVYRGTWDRLRLVIAVSAGILTLAAVGIWALLNSGNYLKTGSLAMYGGMTLVAVTFVELPLYIASRVNPGSCQDRLIALWMLMAGIALQFMFLLPGGTPSHAPVSVYANGALTEVVGATTSVSLLAQIALVVLLLIPLGRSTRHPVVLT